MRLLGYATGDAIQLGAKRLFSLRNNMSVIYTESKDRVKEDIILYDKPQTNSFYFSISSDLQARKAPDGYHLYNRTMQEKFFLPNPTVVDSKGKEGKAWMDVSTDTIVLSVDQDFLDKASYPVTVDPTVISTGSGQDMTGAATQRNTFFDGQLYWAFHTDGTNIVYENSSDTANNWSDPTTLVSGDEDWEFSVWYDQGIVYVAFNNGYSIDVKRGVINDDEITWSNQVTALTGSSSTTGNDFPVITKDSSGKIWVSATNTDYSSSWNKWIKARRTTNADDITSWETTIHNVSPTDDNWDWWTFSGLVPLDSGQLYAYWQIDTDIKGRLFDGTSWESTTTTLATSYWSPYMGALASSVADTSGKLYILPTQTHHGPAT